MVDGNSWLSDSLEKGQLTTHKLRKLFGLPTEKAVNRKSLVDITNQKGSEFGNGNVTDERTSNLIIGIQTEQTDGLIIDWELFKNQPPSDSKLLKSTLVRIKKYYGEIESSCADRGFSDQKNDAFLQEHKIYNAICPKSPRQLQEKLSDSVFLSLQTRRSQTEARIGIFKNVFCGKPLRSRITAYKKLAISWCVLTHNLWVLSRKAIDIESSMLKKAA